MHTHPQPTCTLRPARKSDFRAIRLLIHQVRINPAGLDWRRFIVSIDSSDRLIGCGQLKPHSDGSWELASIAVHPAWRKRGVATSLIRALINSHPRPLYLTSRSELEPFYAKFGFRCLEFQEMNPYFRRLYRLARIVFCFSRKPGKILVMYRDSSPS